MAELSVEEARVLSRRFLTGIADSGDIDRLATALPNDQTLALELLAQMQAALDDVAPTALSVEQDKSVDARIEALIAPRIKKRGLMGWIRKIFMSRPKKEAAPSRRRRKGEAPEPEVAPPELPAPSQAPVEDDGFGDMAPIAPGGAAPPAPESSPAAEAAPAKAKPKKAGKPLPWKPILLGLFALILLGGLGYGGWAWWQGRPKSEPKAAPVPTPQPTAAVTAAPAAPTVQPTPQATPSNSSPVRVRSTGAPAEEPLPALLPPTTPQPAGELPLQP